MRVDMGELRLSQQRADEIAKWRCEDKANLRYAMTGERSACVCGFHESPVPLAPLFDND